MRQTEAAPATTDTTGDTTDTTVTTGDTGPEDTTDPPGDPGPFARGALRRHWHVPATRPGGPGELRWGAPRHSGPRTAAAGMHGASQLAAAPGAAPAGRATRHSQLGVGNSPRSLSYAAWYQYWYWYWCWYWYWY